MVLLAAVLTRALRCESGEQVAESRAEITLRHSTFEFTMDGEQYLQISIEKLKTIPRNSLAELSIWWFEDSVTKGKTFYEVVKEIQEIKQKTGGFSLKLIQEFQAELQGSKRNDWLLLYSTIQALSAHMKKAKGLGWDLHTENAMMRSDGTVVITDPFTDPSKW